jgi:16S rRNA (cytidine1402-2'-O)-methyltransferase
VARDKAALQSTSSFPSWHFPTLAQGLLRAAEFSGDPPTSKAAGRLHLIGTPIGNRGDITLRALLTLAQVDAVLCEDTRVTGALLHAYGISRPLLSYHEHNAAAREAEVLERLQRGEQLGLVSDAGMPLIADPGLRLVQACHLAGIAVTVCPGASAILAGLAVAGLPPLPFLFGGFLPPKTGARRKALAGWQTLPATLVFYETPPRLVASLQDMAAVLGDRQAAVGRELTKHFEECPHGLLSALAAHYAAHPPKGEIVVIIAPPDPTTAITAETELRTLLQTALTQHSLRDAVATVSQRTGTARDTVYKIALALKHAADDA